MLQDDPSQGDAQLVNSAYLDNDSAELYHGRLDKKPNALALRLRWCALLPLLHIFQMRGVQCADCCSDSLAKMCTLDYDLSI